MSAAARNGYRSACVAFGNWCAGKWGRLISPSQKRLSGNPFAGVRKANERVDLRRQRRAMTEEELVRLIDATRRRPLLEAMTIRRGKDKGKAIADVKPGARQRLELLGRERTLIYKALALAGLRKRELASLTVGRAELDGPGPRAWLRAADEKNRQGSEISLRADLAADLRQWLADKLEALRDDCPASGKALPSHLPADTPLLNVPTGLVRILDRDLKLAGIPKRDNRGRTIDVHALRMTFGTHLSKGGVPLRTAQAAMCHSAPSLTANVYTDPKLLNVRGALDSLPSLPLDGPKDGREKMTGTDAGKALPAPLVPMLVPEYDDLGKPGTIAGKTASGSEWPTDKGQGPESPANKGSRRSPTSADNCGPNGRYWTRTSDFFLVREDQASRSVAWNNGQAIERTTSYERAAARSRLSNCCPVVTGRDPKQVTRCVTVVAVQVTRRTGDDRSCSIQTVRIWPGRPLRPIRPLLPASQHRNAAGCQRTHRSCYGAHRRPIVSRSWQVPLEMVDDHINDDRMFMSRCISHRDTNEKKTIAPSSGTCTVVARRVSPYSLRAVRWDTTMPKTCPTITSST